MIYINDISDNLHGNSYLFADDTSLFQPVRNGNINNSVRLVNEDLDMINRWSKQWLVSINAKKTVSMLFSRKRQPSLLPDVYIGASKLSQVDDHKHLGVILTKDLSWSKHIDSLVTKSNKIIGSLKRFKYSWPRATLELCYKSFVLPILEYGNILYDNCLVADKNNLESVQINALNLRLVTGGKKGTSHHSLYNELGWLTLKS